MARVKRGVTTKKRHQRLLQKTEGYRGTKSKLVKVAHEAMLHAGAYAYAGRRLRKRQMRRTWITTISAALTSYGMKYNQFIKALNQTKVSLNRKSLSDIALNHPDQLKMLLEKLNKDKDALKPKIEA